MRNRFLLFSYLGLFVIVAGLFALSWRLNRSQYVTAVQSVRSDLYKILHEDIARIRQQLREREQQTFALMDLPDLPISVTLSEGLFLVRESKVFPSALSDLYPGTDIDPETAARAYDFGMETMTAGKKMKALEYFQTAGKISVQNRKELHLRASAYLQILKLTHFHDRRALFHLLYILLEAHPVQLDRSQIAFFQTALRQHVSGYDLEMNRSRALWEQAHAIERAIAGRHLPLRKTVGTTVVSVDVKGRIIVFPENWYEDLTSLNVARLSFKKPGDDQAIIHEELDIVPSLFAWIPLREFTERKEGIQKRYHLANLTLCVMLLLVLCLASGMVYTLRREREIAALRESFVATVSHELRTPLALIHLYAETLRNVRVDEKKTDDYLQSILLETDRLSGLINNVLDFSRLKRGRRDLHATKVDLSVLCERIVESFSFRLEKEGFTLQKCIETDVVTWVDSMAFSQVVFNLLDNAAKYSGESRTLDIVLMHEGKQIVLLIKDQGIGVPRNMKSRIFLPFVRVEDRAVTSKRGSGIGLSVIKEFIDQIGGTIEVRDNEPCGSIFKVSLPERRES